jgi:CSLREA domain-containing protein
MNITAFDVLKGIIATFSFCLVLTCASFAATFTVTKTADTNDGVCDSDCSLREAIAAANAAATDDIIAFDPTVFGTARSVTLNNANGGGLVIANNGSLTLNGPGSQLLTINGNNNTIVFNISGSAGGGANVSISGVTITGGNGAFLNSGTLTLTNVSVSGNGGSIVNDRSLTINSSVISNNTSDLGAGVQNRFSGNSFTQTVVINDSIISNNSSSGSGGGIFNAQTGSVTLNNSVVTGNTAAAGGGIVNSGSLTLNNSHIDQNTATGATSGTGGGIQHFFGTATITGSTISGNHALSAGGGINNDEGTVNLTDSVISGNTSTNNEGGGLYTSLGTTTVTGGSIINNSACSTCGGGGVTNRGTTSHLSITGSSIMNNSAATAGGILTDNSAVTTVTNSIIANNTCGGPGGGMNLGSGTVNLINSTVANNMATGPTGIGGGINNSSGTVNLTQSTVADNTAASSGGGLSNSGGGTVNSHASIIADNSISGGDSQDISGSIVSQGYNLIENISGVSISGTFAGNILGRDAQLVSLRDNGGTTMTVSLQPLSPAIDAGDPSNFPATDQRGVSRAQDGDLNGSSLPDIGAYERQVTTFTVTKTADTNDGICDADCSLREAISAAAVSPGIDVGIVFEPNVFSNPQSIILSGNELNISTPHTLVIAGPGSDLLTISGNNASRVFMISTGSYAAFENLRIANGNGNGSFFPGNGGGILNQQATLGLRSVNISNNTVSTVSGAGGGIYNYRGRVLIADSAIENNTAQQGGGIYNPPNGSVVQITTSTIQNNSASMGAGLFNWETMTIDFTFVRNNQATNFGGGQGIYNTGPSLKISNSEISGNAGGGIYNNASDTLDISFSKIENNMVAGGITNLGTLNLSFSTVSGNVSNSRGGGIRNDGGGLTMTNSLVTRNMAADYGGGIGNNSGALNVSNSTISGNQSNGDTFGGGGVFSDIVGGNIGNFTYVTIAFNQAKMGGGVHNNSGVLQFKDCIVGRNSASVSSPDFQGNFSSNGYNAISNSSGAVITGNTTGNLLDTDPLLDPILRLNNGIIQTHALRKNSPLIDKGATTSPVTITDQRGFLRPVDMPSIPNASGGNASDIGSFERQTNDVVVPAAPFDFDGDGKTDASIFRPSDGTWWYTRSSDGQVPVFQFGQSTDTIAAADFTGDGKTDVAFFRPSTGQWFVLRSEDSAFYAFPFGTNGDIPMPADYDGDGKADAAVFRPSTGTWFILRSSDGQVSFVQLGIPGDQPIAADYDGDGKADPAIFRPNGANPGASEWWIQRSRDGLLAFQFGTPTDKAVPGDYTGDGKADIAFFRPSTGFWYVLRSEDFNFFAFPFGTTGDIPVPGDYDGDGKFDAAVFRPSASTWYLNRSTAGVQIISFGLPTDQPVPNAYVR